jgi:hypothetical protein
MSTRNAVLALCAAALAGTLLTIAAGHEPGAILGVFVITGTVVAGLGIRRGRVYLLFPAPVLVFFVTAIVAGKVHDAKLGSSTASLAAGFSQWVAGIFVPGVVATIVIVLIGGGRWVLDRQLVSQSAPAEDRQKTGNARPAPKPRFDRDSWADEDPFAPPVPAPPAPRYSESGPTQQQQGKGWQSGPHGTRPGGASRPARPAREQRPDLDPWGDPRSPVDPAQPRTGPRPQTSARPAPKSQPEPRTPRPQPGESWPPAPAQRPQRPPRPYAPDTWPPR